MNPVEAIAFVLGVVNVTLVVRRSVWNYPFGMATVALYGVVFADAKLYSDMVLQAFFLVVNAYGWVNWARVRTQAGGVPVGRMTAAARLAWLSGGTVAAVAWGSVMRHYTDAALPWWDATIAIAGVVAQILMARRWIENWVVWIAVDIGSIGLYAAKGLWLTMILYAIFLALAVWGLIDWVRVERREGAA